MELSFLYKRFCCLSITLTILISTITCQHICRDTEPMEASFYMIPEFRTEPMHIKKNNEITMYGSRSCRNIRKTAKRKKESIPLCPAFYVLNFDPNRLPVFVAEAECACPSCGDNSTNICRPLYYYRDILIYSPVRKCYTKTVKQFQNGCHCIKSFRQKAKTPNRPPE